MISFTDIYNTVLNVKFKMFQVPQSFLNYFWEELNENLRISGI